MRRRAPERNSSDVEERWRRKLALLWWAHETHRLRARVRCCAGAAADSDEFLLVQPRKEVLSRGGAKWAIPAARAASLDVTSNATTNMVFIKGAAATIAAHGAINDA